MRLKCELLCNLTIALVLAMASLAEEPANAEGRADEARWTDSKTVDLAGYRITLSKPRLVARSQGYLWFPTMTRLSGGDLCANFSTNPDAIVANRTSSVSWSADDGLTWRAPVSFMPEYDAYAEGMLRLKNGHEQLLPFNLYPDGGAMRGWHQTVSGTKGQRKVSFTRKGLTVSGWPKPDRSFNEQLGLSGFGFNGHGLTGKSGEYLATMYGYFKDERRYSLVMVESTDGLAWKFRSLIAGFDCPLAGGEGPCESQTIRLKDERLMNIFRLASNVPYGQTFSDDDGRTWSEPAAMKDAHSVQPSLALMKDGSLVLTGGRPGIFAWINRAGDGKDWLQVDLQSHHNEMHPQDAITRADQTTSYTEVAALDEQSVIVIYDRIPHGWKAIPQDSQDTNSIWVVKLAWTVR
ncbi:MAG: sialidase family protein [Planctomycetota bacterium]|nr:sialidase family protein [Planctomycetota bacterium]